MAVESPKPAESAPETRVAYVDGKPAAIALRRARLTRLDLGDAGPAPFEFTSNQLRVGAAKDNDLVLEDSTVSRYHCRIGLTGIASSSKTSTPPTERSSIRSRSERRSCDPGAPSGSARRVCGSRPSMRRCPSSRRRPTASARCSAGTPRCEPSTRSFERVAPTDTTVVLEGETGTGKDVVARSIHQRSARSAGPFVVFDCSAVPRELIESELFGHERGSFTGAVGLRKGVFEVAEGGTVFLDELGELAPELQPRLLRVLEQREAKRVGGTRPIKVDVRVVAATNRSLEAEVRAGRFREDLFYRLSVVRLGLPPLRERRDDIPMLIEHLLENARFNRDGSGRRIVERVSRNALEHLLAHDWPGNVRELSNALERAVRFSEQGMVEAHHLPDHVVRPRSRRVGTEPGPQPKGNSGAEDGPGEAAPKPPSPPTFKDAKERWVGIFERDYVAEVLRRHGGNISHASREADLDRKYFRRLMKKHGLHPDSATQPEDEDRDDETPPDKPERRARGNRAPRHATSANSRPARGRHPRWPRRPVNPRRVVVDAAVGRGAIRTAAGSRFRALARVPRQRSRSRHRRGNRGCLREPASGRP